MRAHRTVPHDVGYTGRGVGRVHGGPHAKEYDGEERTTYDQWCREFDGHADAPQSVPPQMPLAGGRKLHTSPVHITHGILPDIKLVVRDVGETVG